MCHGFPMVCRSVWSFSSLVCPDSAVNGLGEFFRGTRSSSFFLIYPRLQCRPIGSIYFKSKRYLNEMIYGNPKVVCDLKYKNNVCFWPQLWVFEDRSGTRKSSTLFKILQLSTLSSENYSESSIAQSLTPIYLLQMAFNLKQPLSIMSGCIRRISTHSNNFFHPPTHS